MENVYLDSKPSFGINAFKVADSAYKRTLGQSILINVFEVKIFNAIVFKVTLQKKKKTNISPKYLNQCIWSEKYSSHWIEGEKYLTQCIKGEKYFWKITLRTDFNAACHDDTFHTEEPEDKRNYDHDMCEYGSIIPIKQLSSPKKKKGNLAKRITL